MHCRTPDSLLPHPPTPLQLLTVPAVRSWSVDSSAVALAQIHGGSEGEGGLPRLVLTAQQNILEVMCGAKAGSGGGVSYQLYGHSGRVSCAELLELPGGRVGVVSGSADQTLR